VAAFFNQGTLFSLLAVLTFAICASPALAQTSTTWTANAGDWFINSNWSFRTPDCSLDAYVNNGGKPEIDVFKATARSLTLGQYSGDSGNLVVDGTDSGTLQVCGDFYIGNQGNGTFTVNHVGQVSSLNGFIAAGSIGPTGQPSHGSVTVIDPGTTWNIGDFTGLAQLLIGIGPGGANGGTGLLLVAGGGRVQVNNLSSQTPAVLIGPSGTLTGDGTVELRNGSSTVMEVRGTIAPSGGGGTLTIGGDLSFIIAAPGDAPTMECTVTYGDVTATPKVALSGTALLTGKLSVTMSGTTFTPGTRYTLLHADGGRFHDSRFSTYSIKYSPNSQCFTPVITYDDNNVYLYLQPCT
jgi:autotransporter family porin